MPARKRQTCLKMLTTRIPPRQLHSLVAVGEMDPKTKPRKGLFSFPFVRIGAQFKTLDSLPFACVSTY